MYSVEISGGEQITTNAGIIGGGFGIEGAAIGIVTAGLVNALTTHTDSNPVVLVLMSNHGCIALASHHIGALELQGFLAPVIVDSIHNRNRAPQE